MPLLQDQIKNANDLKNAYKLLMEHPAWDIVDKYEQNILNELKNRDNSLSIAHPQYERMKAYLQGQIQSLKQLFYNRKQLTVFKTKGELNVTSHSKQRPKPQLSGGFSI